MIFPANAESESGEHAELVDLVTQLGIPLRDATVVLRAAAAAHRDIFLRPFDPHCNPAGHKRIAEWIHGDAP